MPKFSDAEKEMLVKFGIVGVKMVLDAIAAARASGVDLEALRSKMRTENEKSIFDALDVQE